MERPDRPDGVAAIAVLDFLLAIALFLIAAISLFALLTIPLLVFVLFLASWGYGTWTGKSWAWYLLTFGGGFFGWYFARNDVKGFFGIEDTHDEPAYSGD